MKTRMSAFLAVLVMLFCSSVLTSCGGGGGSSDSSASCKNIAGTWIATQNINENSCSSTIDTCKAYVIVQDGCNITVTDSAGTYSGSVADGQGSWTGSYQENGNTITFSADFTFPADPYDGLNGTVTWTNSNAGCSGSADMDAMYKPATTVSSTSPADGEQNVPIDSVITASFSGNVMFTPFGTVTVTANGIPVDGTYSSLPGSTDYEVTFTPSNHLEYNTTYTVTISKNLNCGTWATPMLNDYTWSFSTGAAPVNDFWAPTSVTDAPAPRASHTAVWTGSKMIVWGGQDNNANPVNTGGIYDPATDVWTATTTTGAPSARYGPTAVWTGSKMIVWGGTTDTGGVYDPSTDTWTDVSTINAPSVGFSPTAVWTGSKMIVWGTTGTGGVYDPSTDTWTDVSTINAPSVDSPTAVWTGSEMIVWGGIVKNIGAKYDPAADKWTTISVTNAPTPRTGHTAVWTGTKMIVWGGSDSNSVSGVNTGGIYDPVTDVWKTMSTANAPSAREYHTSVLTGSKMIVWGGYGLSGGEFSSPEKLDTGGVYDPVSDSWSPLSDILAPSARDSHTAVWTGTSMIIWGGYDTTPGVTATGGIYTP